MAGLVEHAQAHVPMLVPQTLNQQNYLSCPIKMYNFYDKTLKTMHGQVKPNGSTITTALDSGIMKPDPDLNAFSDEFQVSLVTEELREGGVLYTEGKACYDSVSPV